MKILLASHSFSPAIGGIETCSLALAQAFSELGHEVRIMTQTLSDNPNHDHGLRIIRGPSPSMVLAAIRWCDVFFQNNISLKTVWPLAFVRRPWVVATHTWLQKPGGSAGGREYLKRLALRLATNVYISRAIENHVGSLGKVVPNPYDHVTFRVMPEITRERSLVFLGRLVSDKGCDLLLQSLDRLRNSGVVLPLTIIGAGPEEQALKEQVERDELQNQVRFVGPLRGEALARELNRHLVLVVPSRWKEPFGLVALEGIACGCLVVGSSGGGLPEAIGYCGYTFKTGDALNLAEVLRRVFESGKYAAPDRVATAAHLKNHRSDIVAAHYLKIFKKACFGRVTSGTNTN